WAGGPPKLAAIRASNSFRSHRSSARTSAANSRSVPGGTRPCISITPRNRHAFTGLDRYTFPISEKIQDCQVQLQVSAGMIFHSPLLDSVGWARCRPPIGRAGRVERHEAAARTAWGDRYSRQMFNTLVAGNL